MTYHPAVQALLAFFERPPVAYYAILARKAGGVTCAVMLSQLLYWHGKGAHPDGWIWKTIEEMEDETGLTRHEQDGARAKLEKQGLIEVKLMGIPAKRHFRLNLEAIAALFQIDEPAANKIAEIRQTEEIDEPDCQEPESKVAEVQQTRLPKTANNVATKRQAITENTKRKQTKEIPKNDQQPVFSSDQLKADLSTRMFPPAWTDCVQLMEFERRDGTLIVHAPDYPLARSGLERLQHFHEALLLEVAGVDRVEYHFAAEIVGAKEP